MKYHIDEVIDFTVVKIFQNYSLFSFCLTVILEFGYAGIVYLTTTKKMQFFRILTFFYIAECIFVEFLMLCWKPARLYPFTIIYPTGILSPMGSTLSATLFASIVVGHAIFVETLTIIVAERHFQIVMMGKLGINKKRIWVYSLMALSLIATVIPLFMFILMDLNDAKVEKLLNAEIENAEKILQFQPSLFSLNFEIGPLLLTLLGFCVIYAGFRIAIFIFVLKENYKFVKSSMASEKTKRQFALMFQSTMTQFLTTLFFAFFAMAWILTLFFPGNSPEFQIASQCFVGIFISYPIADVIIVVTVVKGYRNTLKKIWKAIFGKNQNVSSGAGFHSIPATTIIARKRSIFLTL